MKNICLHIITSVVIFLGMQTLGQAQEYKYILNVRSGGTVDFNLYSLYHYNNGVDLENWTRLDIYYDTTGGPHLNKWYLGVKAQDDAFYSNYPAQTLSLEELTLTVEDGGGTNQLQSSELTSGNIPIDDQNYTLLVTEGDDGHYILNINYHLDTLTGHPPGYYNTNLIFHMDTILPPW